MNHINPASVKNYDSTYSQSTLALHGAEVIKVEPPGGEVLRFRSTEQIETHEFLMLNSNKKSVVIDLKQAAGCALLERLITSADVVIENYAPGVMERLGLDPQRLLQENPRLIYASGKGYGLAGPYAHMAAMDITVQAMGGVISSTGFPDSDPVKTGPAFVDFLGGIHLYAGITTALFQRERTGRGQMVEVSMHDTVYPTLASLLGGIYNNPEHQLPERTGNKHAGLAVAPYNVYRAKDGYIAIISASERHFRAVLKVVGHPELADDPRFADRFARAKNMQAMDDVITSWTTQHERWCCVDLLSQAGAPCAPVLTVREVANDKHLEQRGMIRHIDHPRRGAVRVPGSPIRLSDAPVIDIRPAPALGEATETILTALGYQTTEIESLRKIGAIQ